MVTSYAEAGDGPVVLLLHGWGSSAAPFESLQEELSKSFHVYAVDLPGFGKSEDPSEVWDCVDYAYWVRSFMRKIKIDTENPMILGHSFGGKIAEFMSDITPIRKLVLVGSSGLILDATKKKRKNNSKYVVIKNVLERIVPKPIFKSVNEVFIQRFGSADYKNANAQMRKIFKTVILSDTRDFAAGISAPTLLVWGEKDKASPLEMGRIYEKIIPHATLVVMPACGHYPFLDKKAEFNNLIYNFFKDNDC
jgi:pimeloyl-ACP methyl ester carboxylesterase